MGKVINGYKINCVDVNCTNEDDANTTQYINKFNVEGYPTIKMLKDSKVIDFNLQSKESFENFYLISFISKIESVLNLEKEEIIGITLKFEEENLKSFSKDYYKFNLSWKQENNNYLVDIFINKRGD